jgi:hypothetical protein
MARFVGTAGNDTITPATISAGVVITPTGANLAGNDYISGGSGNDYISGGFGNDSLLGGFGNDSLLGGVGNDLIFGGPGDDRLVGGRGRDTLIGDGDNDRFVFNEGDSGAGQANRDVINNFHHPSGGNGVPTAYDLIDLSSIIPGTLKFTGQVATGNEAFSAPGEVRWFRQVGGDQNGMAVVQINVSGNAGAELEIAAPNTMGTNAPWEGWFVL